MSFLSLPKVERKVPGCTLRQMKTLEDLDVVLWYWRHRVQCEWVWEIRAGTEKERGESIGRGFHSPGGRGKKYGFFLRLGVDAMERSHPGIICQRVLVQEVVCSGEGMTEWNYMKPSLPNPTWATETTAGRPPEKDLWETTNNATSGESSCGSCHSQRESHMLCLCHTSPFPPSPPLLLVQCCKSQELLLSNRRRSGAWAQGRDSLSTSSGLGFQDWGVPGGGDKFSTWMEFGVLK